MSLNTGGYKAPSKVTFALLLLAPTLTGFLIYEWLIKDQPANKVSADVAVPPQTSDQIIDKLRDRFGLSNESVKTTPVSHSIFPPFREMTFSFGKPPYARSQRLYISGDGRYAIQGQIFDLTLSASIKDSVSANDRPHLGPANAPVTIIEFYDYQCPSCAEMEGVMKDKIVPKYGQNIRIVFKSFPNTPDDWGMEAAAASECVFRSKPEVWYQFRSAVFNKAKQHAFNRGNARQLLVGIGEEVGGDGKALAACLDAGTSLSAVARDTQEGQSANVAGTPTFFVNDRVLAGVVPEDAISKAIDNELAATNDHCHCIR